MTTTPPKVHYLEDERHTLASALRPRLEAEAGPTDFVACTLMHPLDTQLVVEVPCTTMLCRALLGVLEDIDRARRVCTVEGA